MPLKKYTNNIPTSDISAIYTYLEAPKPRVFIEYKNQACEAHRFDQIIDILNKSTTEPTMILSDDLKEAIYKDSGGIIAKDVRAGIYCWDDKEKYQNLHRESAAQQHAQTSKEEELLSIPTTHIPWFKFQSNFDSIVQAAHDILDENPNSKIFSLGQSPAWIVKAAEYINALKHGSQTFGYIPFSGGFYEVVDEFDVDMEFHPNQFRPTAQQEEFYHKVLDQRGLNPQAIIESYRSHNTKTAIMDFIHTGKGLASFLSVLFSWAKQEGIAVDAMKSALDIVLLVTSEEDAKNSLKFDDIGLKCKNQIIEEIWNLANGVDTGLHSDRLVPNYPYSKWDNAPQDIAENSDFIKVLMDKISMASQSYTNSLYPSLDKPALSDYNSMSKEALLHVNDEVSVSGNLVDSDLV